MFWSALVRPAPASPAAVPMAELAARDDRRQATPSMPENHSRRSVEAIDAAQGSSVPFRRFADAKCGTILTAVAGLTITLSAHVLGLTTCEAPPNDRRQCSIGWRIGRTMSSHVSQASRADTKRLRRRNKAQSRFARIPEHRCRAPASRCAQAASSAPQGNPRPRHSYCRPSVTEPAARLTLHGDSGPARNRISEYG